jgi:hypothetical protein
VDIASAVPPTLTTGVLVAAAAPSGAVVVVVVTVPVAASSSADESGALSAAVVGVGVGRCVTMDEQPASKKARIVRVNLYTRKALPLFLHQSSFPIDVMTSEMFPFWVVRNAQRKTKRASLVDARCFNGECRISRVNP